jgi:NAD-dependent deacetylase
VRPGVVRFGEALDPSHVAQATAATDCDVFLTIGTSAVVHPAAGLVHQARARGALTIEINPEATEATSRVDIVLSSPAEQILPELDHALSRS